MAQPLAEPPTQKELNDWLFYIVGKGDVSAITQTLKDGAEIHARDNMQNTLLHTALSYGNTVDVIKALLAAGAEVNAQDSGQNTPLHLAAQYGRNDALVTLLEAGAEVNVRNNAKQTPLHSAALSGNIKAVKALLAAGADPRLQDSKGKPPKDVVPDAYSKNADLARFMEAVAFAPSKRPTPEDVGLDMKKRNAALGIPISEAAIMGKHTARVAAMQTNAALKDPSEGI